MTPVDEYFKWMALGCLVAVTTYMTIYGLATRWYRFHVGRALMIKAAGLALLLLYSELFLFLGPSYRFREELRTVGITLLLVGLVYALVAMIRELRLGRLVRRH